MIIIFLVLIISLPYSLSFNCPDIDKNSQCRSAQGCEWSNGLGICEGDIENLKICEESECIFFWNNATKNSKEKQAGSLQTPYSSFEKVLKSLDNLTNYHLVAINTDSSEYQLKEHNFGPQNITIQPFFEKEKFTLIYVTQTDDKITLTNETSLIFKNTDLIIDQDFAEGNQSIIIFTDENNNNNVEIVKSQCQLSFLNSNLVFKYVRQRETNSQLASFQFCDFFIENSTIVSNETFRIIQLLAKENLQRKPKIELKNSKYTIQQSKEILNVENAELQIENVYILDTTTYDQDPLDNIYLFFILSSELNVYNLTIRNTKSNAFYMRDTQISFNISNFIDNQASKLINISPNTKTGINRANFTQISFKGTLIDQQILFIGANVYLSKIKMDKVKFFSPSYNSYIQTGVCLLSYFNRVEIVDSMFSNFQDTCIYLHYSSLDIKNSIFYGNKTRRSILEEYVDEKLISISDIRGSIIATGFSKYVQDSRFPYTQNIKLKSSQFLVFTNFISDGGALSTRHQNHLERSIEIVDCTFLGIQAIGDGGSISLTLGEKTLVQSSIFSNHGQKKLKKLADSGGALSIYYSQIESCIFTNLQSNTYGGAIQSFQNTLEENMFHQNTALFGGAINAMHFQRQVKSTNSFVFNQAKVRGGVIFYSDHSIFSGQQNSTYPNFDSKGLSFNYTMESPSCIVNKYKLNTNWNLVGKDPDFEKLIQNNNEIFEKTESFYCNESQITRPVVNISYKFGNSYKELIEVIITENYTDQVNQDFNGLDLCLTLVDYDYINQLKECKVLSMGKAYFSGFNMSIDVPNIAQFKTTKLNGVNGFINIFLDQLLNGFALHVRLNTDIEFCGEGDYIIDKDNSTCEPCPQYTYSLKVPKFLNDTCLPCPDNMVCVGGNDVLPLPGYYRPSLSSTKAVECLNEIACIGGIKEDQLINKNGFCKDKFRGVLCSQCESGYIPTQNSQSCIECENDVFFYFKMIGIMIFTLGVFVNIWAIK